ncbi:hypothetical protein E9531_07435 [Lampropedia puyangensis]|uniref:Uncharacterized protein n=1 Tax=Lampropedia puyangensis TaxID=1330072 RepID=A0A4V4GRJ5_9BURK|nr:hypothetical protein [Lampropedia puyangensis]THU02506.1 hypothetical protein E9531_07435 [Lampropedia puyangensis]
MESDVSPENSLPLSALLARQGSKNAFWLLHEIHSALTTHLTQTKQALPPAWQPWWSLIRFSLGVQSIAVWLRDERSQLQRIHALAALSQQEALADILSEALQGQAQAATSITFSQLGAEDICLSIQDGSSHHYENQDWSSTDTLIALACDGFTQTVAALITAEQDKLPLPAVSACTKLGAQLTNEANADSIALPCALRQTLRLTRLAARSLGVQGEVTHLPIRHTPGDAMDSALLEFYTTLWPDDVIHALLTAYSAFDGGHWFCHGETVGLTLFPIQIWQEQQQRMLEHAYAHAWHEQQNEVPEWLKHAVCFAQNGAESEYWILITQGHLRGCVLLSETDAWNAQPRFASVAEFFTALHAAPERILNASGNLHFKWQGQLYEAVGLASP